MSQSYYDTSYPPSLWAPPAPPPPVPTATSVTPNTAVAGATAVTITVAGTNFTADAVVRLGATSLATTYVSATSLTAVIPTVGAAGPYNVTVGNAFGTSNAVVFTSTAAVEESPAV